MSARLEWSGQGDIIRGMQEYERRVYRAVRQVALYFAPVIESAAKSNAPWVDRTGNARMGLRGFVQDLSETIVAIYLTHSVEYGIYLERAHQARYAVIMPTLELHYGKVKAMLDGIFK